MRLICPSCGACHSLEAWRNDPAWRQFAEALVKLPGPVQSRVLPYLGLFRKGERGLTAMRALKILDELVNLVKPGTIRWEGGEERPAPPTLWAEALDVVLDRRPQALKNHNYLRHVAWEMARGLAAKIERDREMAILRGTRPDEDLEAASDNEREEIAEMLRKFAERHGVPKS